MRGFACVGLHMPKNNLNIGGVLRASQIFGVSMVAVAGTRYRKAPTDTMKAHRHIPLLCVEGLHAVIPFDCIPVAVERLVGAVPLPEYRHPTRAFYIFGPEDGTLGRKVTDWCRDTIYIPAGCLNLAACVNVVLYDRLAKGGRP